MTSFPKQAEGRPVTALLGRKLGMTQVWDEAGQLVPVSVVAVGTNVVTQLRTMDNDGYDAVQLAYGAVDPRRVTQPLKGHFAASGTTPRRFLTEVRTSGADSYELGQEIGAAAFEAGASVDVSGTTKGKGTAGVMKRHGFGGAISSHGAKRNHRKAGAVGGAATPGRVFPGHKMAGRMGNERRTIQNLTVQGIDAERGLLLIAGPIPGPKKGLVVVRSSVKGA